MSFSKDELRTLRISLIMTWEVKQGIEWTVNNVNVLKLVNKLEGMINDP